MREVSRSAKGRRASVAAERFARLGLAQVPVQAGQWRDGLDPWQLTVRGDRWHGRGTADNKGQHCTNLVALDQAGKAPALLPNLGGTLPNDIFARDLGEAEARAALT
jgi:hypothetical protein